MSNPPPYGIPNPHGGPYGQASGSPYPYAPPAYGGGGLAPRRPDIQGESAAARRASVALLVGMVAYPVQYIANAFVIDETGRVFRDAFSGSRVTSGQFQLSSGAQAAQGIGQIASLASLVVGIIVVVWLYKAAENAAIIGYYAALSPIWAVFAWVVPIVNFWFPYQIVRDTLAPDNPARTLVGRWWTFYLLPLVGGCGVVFFLFADAGKVAPLVLSAVMSGLMVMAGLTLRQVMQAVTDDHTEAARRQFGYTG